MPHRRSPTYCPAGRHRFRGRWHNACPEESMAHWHVRCGRCTFRWYQLALFPAGAAVIA